jgi:DNA modification methylase
MNGNSQATLFDAVPPVATTSDRRKMREPFGRIDSDEKLRARLLPYCRLKKGEIWEDTVAGHCVGVLDSTEIGDVRKIVGDKSISLVVNDPPYNIVLANRNSAGLGRQELQEYMVFSERWTNAITPFLGTNAHVYVWMGADVHNGFQPLPDFMLMMRHQSCLEPRNFITVRNQRGYGTQHNWMWVRQELLHYVKGSPEFTVVYTDIPKVLKGYYKDVGGQRTENIERSKSDTIRPGNVWIDIQQVFYRLEENVSGAYAQKPLKAIERILVSSSHESDIVFDGFAHSGTTLIAGERTKRRVLTFDIDPIFAELSIRRLEHLRKTGRTGWQCDNPFPEVDFS